MGLFSFIEYLGVRTYKIASSKIAVTLAERRLNAERAMRAREQRLSKYRPHTIRPFGKAPTIFEFAGETEADLCRQWLAKNPNDTEALFRLGVLFHEGKLEPTINDVQGVWKDAKASSFKEGDTIWPVQIAAVFYERVLKINRYHREAIINLATCLQDPVVITKTRPYYDSMEYREWTVYPLLNNVRPPEPLTPLFIGKRLHTILWKAKERERIWRDLYEYDYRERKTHYLECY